MNNENSSGLELAIGCINMELMEKALLSASCPICIFVFVYFSFLSSLYSVAFYYQLSIYFGVARNGLMFFR